jgi:multiple sugar transport system substrate-binding protein
VGASGAVCAAGSLHLAAAMPNLLTFERMIFDNPLHNRLLKEPVGSATMLEGGALPLPEGPGLGIELNMAEVERWRASSVEPRGRPTMTIDHCVITRRTLPWVVGGVLLGTALGAAAQDKPDKLIILSHKVHNTVATGSQGGDVTADWIADNSVGVEWVTMDTGPLHERLFRELSLGETSIDIAFLLNTNAVQSVTALLEPLGPHMEADPIEDFDDVFGGLVDGMTFGGELYGIPFRHASSCFHYNERILNERGVARPTTMEELVEAAEKLTFERDDGTKVHGFIITGEGYANVVDIARAWDGDFITLDYRVATTEPGMIKAVQTLADFYEAGVLPKNWAAVKNEEVNTWLQTGRAAMAIASCGRNRIYNDPEKSQESGNIKTVALPVSADFKGQFEVAPAKVEFWTIVIPKNSQNKELAWDLVKTMLSKENTLKAALNGNGPVRASTYDEPQMAEMLPYAADEKAVLLVGRVPLPPFDESAKAADIFVEEVQAAVLGMKPVEAAMADVKMRVEPLLPQ